MLFCNPTWEVGNRANLRLGIISSILDEIPTLYNFLLCFPTPCCSVVPELHHKYIWGFFHIHIFQLICGTASSSQLFCLDPIPVSGWYFTTLEAKTPDSQGCLVQGESPLKCPASVSLFRAPHTSPRWFSSSHISSRQCARWPFYNPKVISVWCCPKTCCARGRSTHRVEVFD